MSDELWGVWVSGGGGRSLEQWMYDPTKWTPGGGDVRFEGTREQALTEAAAANERYTHVAERLRPHYEARVIPRKEGGA